MENIDVFLWRRCFFELPPRSSGKQKSSSKAFKRSAKSTPAKARSQYCLACEALKNHETSDAKSDGKSVNSVLFDVLKVRIES